VILVGIFGSKLTAQFGDECPTAWHRIVADLTNAELSRGLRWMKEEGREWPPAATEFYALCRKPEAPRPPPYVALPAPPVDKAKALPHINATRKAVGLPPR
jgi:hypothetical protein